MLGEIITVTQADDCTVNVLEAAACSTVFDGYPLRQRKMRRSPHRSAGRFRTRHCPVLHQLDGMHAGKGNLTVALRGTLIGCLLPPGKEHGAEPPQQSERGRRLRFSLFGVAVAATLSSIPVFSTGSPSGPFYGSASAVLPGCAVGIRAACARDRPASP